MSFMKVSRSAGFLSALLASAMLTAALMGILFFAWRVAGLPFVPFDLFDRTTRVLPGRLIAFGIGTMVTVIRALNLGQTAETAKLAEQTMGVAGLFLTGVIGGAILFAILGALRRGYGIAFGLALGIILGIPIMLISVQASQTASVGPEARAIWVLLAFVVWGAVLGSVEQRLIYAQGTAPAEASVERVDRRTFLIRLGGATAAITVGGAVVGELAEARRREAVRMAGAESMRWSTTHPLPNANAAVKPAPGTRPEFTPLERHYRIDINTIPPAVDGRQWRLKVNGLVEKPLALTLEDLRRYAPMHQFITLSCISNPVGGDLIGTQRWTGVSLQRLLPDLQLKPGATHLKIRSADRFYEVVALDAIKADERIMLAYEWDGVPLTREHGFPLRIYIPNVHGMKQPKWIESIEAIDHWEPGYWVVRDWDREARMKATSVIDTIGVNMMIGHPGAGARVPIGGIAHAGVRGISKVEVRVDNGEWEPAQLRTPLSGQTWVIWRYDWPFQKGKHTFAVRCFDGTGAPQIVEEAPPHPSGATGLHVRSAML